MHTNDQAFTAWCFEILKISPTSDTTLIKKAYYKQAKIHHPDIEGGSEEAMKNVQFAFDFLTNEEVRSHWSKQNVYDMSKLAVILNSKISFREAFFGTSVVFNYNVAEVDQSDMVITKELEEVERVNIDIPPGSFLGLQANYNEKGFRYKDLRGALQVNISVEPSKKFQVDPNTGLVLSAESVSLNTMLTGGKISVETMHGIQVIKIPPGTPPNSRIMVKGKGFNGADHCIIVSPIFPNKEELKQDKWSNFKVDWDLQKEIDDDKIEEFRSRFGNQGPGAMFINGVHYGNVNGANYGNTNTNFGV
jgi:DnaJ-class molecular chaperone